MLLGYEAGRGEAENPAAKVGKRWEGVAPLLTIGFGEVAALEVELRGNGYVGDLWKESCPRRSDRRILPAAKSEGLQSLD